MTTTRAPPRKLTKLSRPEVAETHGEDPLLRSLLHEVSDALEAPAGLMLVGAERPGLTFVTTIPSAVRERRTAELTAACARVCATGQPIGFDAKGDVMTSDVGPGRGGAVAAQPLRVHNDLLGALCVIGDETRRFSRRDWAALRIAAFALAHRVAGLRTKVNARTHASATVGEGTVIEDRWQLLAPIGSGGQGGVWRARELESRNEVAVKIGTLGAAVLAEARALAAVRHANLVAVHAAGRLPDGRDYFVMEYVGGAAAPADRRLVVRGDLDQAFRRLGKLVGAVMTLHGAGYLHGDVKRSNVLIDHTSERAVLIDLGLGLRAGVVSRCPGGTPGSSAPEQFLQRSTVKGREIDVYGLAALTWQLLSGSRPFASDATSAAIVKAQLEARFRPFDLEHPHAEAVADVLRRAMDPVPANRHRSPVELWMDLRAAGGGGDPEANPGTSVPAGAALADVGESLASPAGRTRAPLRATPVTDSWLAGTPLANLLRDARYRSPLAVEELGRRLAQHRTLAQLHDLNLPATGVALAEALPGVELRLYPFLDLAWGFTEPTTVSGTVGRQGDDDEFWQALLSGLWTGAYAEIGLELQVEWGPDKDDHRRYTLRWARP